MLTLTPNATAVIQQITTSPEVPEGAGLRIATEGDAFALTVTTAPEPDDRVMQEEGARVFLDAPAAETLDDKTLDAQVDPDGSVQFLLAE